MAWNGLSRQGSGKALSKGSEHSGMCNTEELIMISPGIISHQK